MIDTPAAVCKVNYGKGVKYCLPRDKKTRKFQKKFEKMPETLLQYICGMDIIAMLSVQG